MKKYFAILCSLVLLSLFAPSVSILRAQSTIPKPLTPLSTSTTPLAGYSQLPEVVVTSIPLSTNTFVQGEKITGTFVLKNTSSFDSPTTYYTISLVGNYQKNTLAGTQYDITSKQGPIYVKAKTDVPVNFTYTIPFTATGKGLGIQIRAYTSTGIPLGWSDHLITVTGNGPEVTVSGAYLKIGANNFALQAGPMVSATATPILSLSLVNNSKDQLTLTPKIDLYNRVAIGTPISSATGAPVILAAKKTASFNIPLPLNNRVAGVYVVEVSMSDAKNIQVVSMVEVRYIIAGDIVTIQSLSADKPSVKTGDTLTLTLTYSGSPFDILNGAIATQNKHQTDITVANENGDAIGTYGGQIDYNKGAVQKIPIVVTKDAGELKATVVVTDGAKILATYSSPLSQKEIQQNKISDLMASYLNYIIFALIIIILIVLAVFLILKKRNGLVKILFFFIVVSVFSGLAVHSAQAFVVTGRAVSGNDENPGDIAVSVSSPYSGQRLLPGQQFYFTFTQNVFACTNTNEYSIDYVSTTWGQGYSQTVGNRPGSGGHDKYSVTDSDVSFGPFTAPMTPGNYNIYLTVDNYWGGGIVEVSGYQPITVGPPPPLPPTNLISSCSEDGTKATLSWTLPAGYSNSYFRAYDRSNGETFASPSPGAYTGTFSYVNGNGETSIDNLVGNSYVLNVVPGSTYTWWVHTRDPNVTAGWAATGSWSYGVFSSVSCPVLQKDLSCGATTYTVVSNPVPGAIGYGLFLDDTTTGAWPAGTACGTGGSTMSAGDLCVAMPGPSYTVPVKAGHSYTAKIYPQMTSTAWWVASDYQTFSVPTVAQCVAPISSCTNDSTKNVAKRIVCSSTGQTCLPTYDINFNNTQAVSVPLKLDYTVHPGHCSSVEVNVYVDGSLSTTTQWMGWTLAPANLTVGPAKTSVIIPAVTPGNHLISLSATGKTGGCNLGKLVSWGGYVSITCQIPVLPDLTASTAYPVAAQAGTPTNLSAVISNANNTTGVGFTNLFQRASTYNSLTGAVTGVVDIGTSASAALLASSTVTASASYTFPTVGTYFIRACADKSSVSDTGVVAESNETNNCSPTWTTIVVSNAAINGSCGPANTKNYPNGTNSYPDAQCLTGTPSDTAFPTAGNSKTWTCSGLNGGSQSIACSASQQSSAVVVGVPPTCSTPNPSVGVNTLVTWSVTAGDPIGYVWRGTGITDTPYSGNYLTRYSTIGKKTMSLVNLTDNSVIPCTAGSISNSYLQVTSGGSINEF